MRGGEEVQLPGTPNTLPSDTEHAKIYLGCMMQNASTRPFWTLG